MTNAGNVWVLPGAAMTFDYIVVNDGPATATFDVEFFLSRTPTWSTNDVYLGRATVSGLAAGLQHNGQLVANAPWHLEDGVHYVVAVLDRQNLVPEVNEGDNERAVPILRQNGGPCFTKLEYIDPLLYPHDAATASLAGSSVHPTVVAPCATPGTLYLIAWGCSGTTPGTTLAPGVTLPLNQDVHTQLGLALANGAVFQAFVGMLDAEGLGRATFDLPPGIGLWPSTGHFAALLIDSTPNFAGITNPVAITITP